MKILKKEKKNLNNYYQLHITNSNNKNMQIIMEEKELYVIPSTRMNMKNINSSLKAKQISLNYLKISLTCQTILNLRKSLS